jgi:hypothetical protein
VSTVGHRPPEAGYPSPGARPRCDSVTLRAARFTRSRDLSPCPQFCAQVGDSAVRPLSAGPGGCWTAPTCVGPGRPGAPPGRRPRRVHMSSTSTGGQPPNCTGSGDDPAGGGGTRGGDRTTTVHGGRVVHVSTQDDGHRPTADQQGHSCSELAEGVRSPGSTAVMTKMKYFSQGVLQPHSRWGPVAALRPEQCSQQQGLANQGGGRERMGAAHRTGRAGAGEQGTSKGWVTR